MSEERGLVEVPENAMRDDPLAFGLTAPQLGLAGAAAAVAFILNLLPIWLPLRLTLAVLVAAPIFGVAVISIRGEPGYRWLVRFARFARSERRWFVSTPATGDPSGEPDLPEQPGAVNTDLTTARFELAIASDSEPAAPPEERSPMWDRSARLRVVAGETEEPPPSEVRPPELAAPDTPILPHLVGDSRLVCFLSFAGGVGKTTLAVEVASLVGKTGRQGAEDSSAGPVRVLLLDAARFAPAAAIRLGVPPANLTTAWAPDAWRDPEAARHFIVGTRHGVDVLTLPPHPRMSGRDAVFNAPDDEFLAAGARTLLDAAHGSDTGLVVADLGSAIDEGHRFLMERADLVLGVVRPTTESLADAYRLATMARGLHLGRKLALVANEVDDDRELAQIARDAGLDLLAAIPRQPTFDLAGESGVPAWRIKPEVREALMPLARIVWPAFGHTNGYRRESAGLLRGLLPGGHR
jgi:MinD-like ATPase involved in chromosome partitioning or flagellar assembly